jgi:hypothetical protein
VEEGCNFVASRRCCKCARISIVPNITTVKVIRDGTYRDDVRLEYSVIPLYVERKVSNHPNSRLDWKSAATYNFLPEFCSGAASFGKRVNIE